MHKHENQAYSVKVILCIENRQAVSCNPDRRWARIVPEAVGKISLPFSGNSFLLLPFRDVQDQHTHRCFCELPDPLKEGSSNSCSLGKSVS